MRKGMDISSYNGTVDFDLCKRNGIEFSINKIIRKDLNRDNQFNNNYKGCNRVGIPWGVYNYTYATTVAKAKSDMTLVCDILDSVDKTHFKYGVWFDLEDSAQASLSKATIANIINAAQDVVESRGYKFGVYTGMSYYNEHIDRSKVKCNNWWIARYYNGYNQMNVNANPNGSYKPTNAGDIMAWQYTSSGYIGANAASGNNNRFDLNILYKEFDNSMAKNTATGAVSTTPQIIHSSIDERGSGYGGRLGDQTGREVYVRNWYNDDWDICIRYPNFSIAKQAMNIAIKLANSNLVGYDMGNRNSLYQAMKKYNFDVDAYIASGELTESDCSSFVYVCYACVLPSMRSDANAPVTSNMRSKYRGFGFEVYTDDKYLDSGSYLRMGDLLVSEGEHTVMSITNGVNSGVQAGTADTSDGESHKLYIGTATVKDGVNVYVRKKTDKNSAIVSLNQQGESVRVYDVVTSADGATWYRLENGYTSNRNGNYYKYKARYSNTCKWKGKLTNCTALNVRMGAGKKFENIDECPLLYNKPETIVEVCDGFKADDGVIWWVVRINLGTKHVYGFVSSKYITKI